MRGSKEEFLQCRSAGLTVGLAWSGGPGGDGFRGGFAGRGFGGQGFGRGFYGPGIGLGLGPGSWIRPLTLSQQAGTNLVDCCRHIWGISAGAISDVNPFLRNARGV
jgi:hypothetical protein